MDEKNISPRLSPLTLQIFAGLETLKERRKTAEAITTMTASLEEYFVGCNPPTTVSMEGDAACQFIRQYGQNEAADPVLYEDPINRTTYLLLERGKVTKILTTDQRVAGGIQLTFREFAQFLYDQQISVRCIIENVRRQAQVLVDEVLGSQNKPAPPPAASLAPLHPAAGHAVVIEGRTYRFGNSKGYGSVELPDGKHVLVTFGGGKGRITLRSDMTLDNLYSRLSQNEGKMYYNGELVQHGYLQPQ